MSSSTVSITANPSAPSLRRSTLIADKKSASDDAIQSEDETTRRNDAKATDSIQIKTLLPANPTAKLRKRTGAKKGSGSASSRAPWKTVVSVIVKNLSLVVILLVLVQMIRRLVNEKHNQKHRHRQNDASSASGVDVMFNSRYERRIDEMERLLKSTGETMRVHVERVDRKVEEEIARLRSELSKRIDGRRDEVLNKLSEFDGKMESMEKVLTSTVWLSKDAFGKFIEDLKGKGKGGDLGEVKLDAIRAFAREIVEEEIAKHAADGLGRVDYAAAAGGAKVLKHSEAFFGGRGFRWWVFTVKRRGDTAKMLQPSFGQPGECFALKGDSGFVEIKLRTDIVPEAITLEHVSKSVAFDRSSAPKDCKVWGWLRNKDARKEHVLTEFTYDLEKSSAQTFNVLLDTEDGSPTVIDTVRLQFMSNHGSAAHTCIYRVRVHGRQSNGS